MNTVVCIASYFKGYPFLEECKNLGDYVILITSENLKGKAWPHHAIDEIYYMPEIGHSEWNLDHLVKGFQYLMKSHRVDAIIALDDYDVEKAAMLRETFRIKGMGQTTYRYFRDKLAMRRIAQEHGIRIPAFTPIFNDDVLNEFLDKNPGPWVLKPRSEASAAGIQKLTTKEEVWRAVDSLGEERLLFLLECFTPGTVYHVDAVMFQNEVQFICCSEYLSTPMEVSHHGGVFRTKTLARDSDDFKKLAEIGTKIMTDFGLMNGATHTEFIKADADGEFYFLETASRVGGAFIPDMVETATGINLWREWAKIENALLNKTDYHCTQAESHFAGLVIALAKEEHPDLAAFGAPELVRQLDIPYHVGLLYRSDSPEKIQELLDKAAGIISSGMLQILPPTSKPTN